MNSASMAQAVQAAAAPKFHGRDTLKSKVVTQFPMGLEREYLRVVNAYTAMTYEVYAKYLPVIRRAITAERNGIRMDGDAELRNFISQMFLKMQGEMEQKASAFDLDRKIKQLANLNRKLTIAEWKRVVSKTLGVDINADYYNGELFREAMQLWTADNVNLIKTIPKNTLSAMQTIVQDGYAAGRTNTQIGKAIAEEYGIERTHAQFLATDQVAKLNAKLTQTQQEDAGIDEYVWTTAGDERVRERHNALNGKTFSWKNPPVVDLRSGRRGHPGDDYRCRCIALPKFNLGSLNLPWESSKE